MSRKCRNWRTPFSSSLSQPKRCSAPCTSCCILPENPEPSRPPAVTELRRIGWERVIASPQKARKRGQQNEPAKRVRPNILRCQDAPMIGCKILDLTLLDRSEERRVGKECRS